MFTEKMIITAAEHYTNFIETVQDSMFAVKNAFYEIKSIEDEAFLEKNLYVELSQDASEFLINEYLFNHQNYLDIKKSFLENFSLGLMLASEKTHRHRFVVTKKGLTDPEGYISELLNEDNKNL